MIPKPVIRMQMIRMDVLERITADFRSLARKHLLVLGL
jgi:hypothetical protein